MRPRLDEASLMILVLALDDYINTLSAKIGDLDENEPEFLHTEKGRAWYRERWTLLMGRVKARQLRVQFMRNLVGDKKGKPFKNLQVNGLDPKEKKLDEKYRKRFMGP